MKKLFVLALAFFCGATFCHAQREYGLKFSSLINDDLTLENAIRLGLENNSEFLSAREEIVIAEQKVKEAKFMYLPQLTLQGTATWYDLDYPMVLPESVGNRFIPNNELLQAGNNGRDSDLKHQFYGVGVSATQYLYSGGRLNNALKMARANLKQVQSKYETVKNAVVFDIKKSFFNLLYAQEKLKLAQEVNAKAQRYYSAMNLSAWDQVRAQYLLSEFGSRASEAQNDLKRAELAMLVSLNKELNAKVTVKGDFKPVKTELDLPHLNLWSMEFRPELKAAIYALELDNLAIDLALSKKYPDVILTGSYDQLGFNNLEDVNKQVSLAVRLPIPYNLGTQYAQKKAEQKQSTLRRSAIEDRIKVQVADHFENMRFWQSEVLSRQDAYETVQKLLTQAERTAKTGVSPLEALTAYFQAGVNYLLAVNKNLSSKAGLEWAIGQDI